MLVFLLAALESEEDRRKFTAVYEQYHTRLEDAAIGILKNQADAEDAVQNAFVQIIRHFEKISQMPVPPMGGKMYLHNLSQTLIRTDNAVEQLNRDIRRTRVANIPVGNSAFVLLCAKLRHIAGTQWGDKKHMKAAFGDASVAGCLHFN